MDFYEYTGQTIMIMINELYSLHVKGSYKAHAIYSII